jgi:Concanavalin A-like lectin/glucanases superfamily
MLAALPIGGLAGPTSGEPDPVGPATPTRLAPFVSAAVEVVVLGFLLAMLLSARGQRNRDVSGAAAQTDVAGEGLTSPRSLAPPRLVPARPPAPAAEVPPETRPEPATPVRGPTAHWRFEDGPGSELARDSSGQGFHCQLRNLDPATAWVKGPVGGAIDLGRKGWLECPLPEARAGVPFDMSVAVWMKRLGPNHHSALLTRQLANDERFHFWFGLRGDLLAVHGDAWKGWTSRTLTAFDSWTHVAFVHAGSETRLYVDGVLARYKNARWPGGRGDDLRPRAHGQRGGDSGRTLTRTPEGPLASI